MDASPVSRHGQALSNYFGQVLLLFFSPAVVFFELVAVTLTYIRCLIEAFGLLASAP
jgi:hypothetical protein